MIRKTEHLKVHLDAGGSVHQMAAFNPSDGLILCDPVTGERVHKTALLTAIKRGWATVKCGGIWGDTEDTWAAP